MWSGFGLAAGAGVSAFVISLTWADAPTLRTHMESYLAAWVIVAVIFFLLQSLATGSKRVALSFALPWLLNATLTGAAVVLQIRAYIIVPLTACIACWAIYRMKVLKGPPLKMNTATPNISSETKIRRPTTPYDTMRRKQSSSAKNQSKPNTRNT